MVRLAMGDEPRFVLERCEIKRSGPSFTLDTVRELQAAQPGADWFLVIGQDQYAGLHTWRDWRELLGRVTLAVANRPGPVAEPHADVRAFAHRAVPLAMLDIASTDIRARVAAGQDISPLVPDGVARYIEAHHLYQRPSGLTREPTLDIRKLQRAIVDGLEDVKAQNIVVFNTEHLSPLFERVIIASGTSNRQTKALAASVRDAVKAKGLPAPRTEGEDNGEWIIVDCGSAVVHVMQPAIRDYYRLEEIWGGKPVKLKVDTRRCEAGEGLRGAGAAPRLPRRRLRRRSRAAPAGEGRDRSKKAAPAKKAGAGPQAPAAARKAPAAKTRR